MPFGVLSIAETLTNKNLIRTQTSSYHTRLYLDSKEEVNNALD